MKKAVIIIFFIILIAVMVIILLNNKLKELPSNVVSVQLNQPNTNKELDAIIVTERTKEWKVENVTIDIKDGTLSNKGTIVIVTDLNEEPHAFNEWFRIDKKDNDTWNELNSKDYSFNEIAFYVKKDRKIEFITDFNKRYDTLKKGKYRLVKRIYDNGYKEFWVEFEIN